MTIIEETYEWRYPLVKRPKTTHLILHHEAGSGSTAQDIHNYHKNVNGWSGIAYHYYVRKNGKIYRGRPEDMQGGHTLNWNQVSIGICFEGNFENEQMYALQFAAGKELILDILKRYPDIVILGHKDVNATACPGKNFPLDEFKHLKIQTEEDEDMDINKFIEQLTPEQAYKIQQKSNEYASKLRPSSYAVPSCLKAVKSGLFSDGNGDGSLDKPMAPVLRQELATILDRKGLLG